MVGSPTFEEPLLADVRPLLVHKDSASLWQSRSACYWAYLRMGE